MLREWKHLDYKKSLIMLLKRINSLICCAVLLITCGKPLQPGVIVEDTTAGLIPDTSAIAAGVIKKEYPVKYDTLRIEGNRQAVRLTLYNEENFGVRTYIPDRDFIPETVASGEGMAIHFIANFGGRKNENARVSIFFPAAHVGIDQLRDMTIGPNGLLAINKWRLIKSFKRAELPYAWAHEQYTFQYRNGDNYFSGLIIIGESNGRPLRVVTQYPDEYADGFPVRANIILKNLKVAPLRDPGL